jgi:hypothetical protein
MMANPDKATQATVRPGSAPHVAGVGAFHKAEIDKWWPIIKAAGIKAE